MHTICEKNDQNARCIAIKQFHKIYGKKVPKKNIEMTSKKCPKRQKKAEGFENTRHDSKRATASDSTKVSVNELTTAR